MFETLVVKGASGAEFDRLLHLVTLGVQSCIEFGRNGAEPLAAEFRRYAEEGNALIDRLDGEKLVLPWSVS